MAPLNSWQLQFLSAGTSKWVNRIWMANYSKMLLPDKFSNSLLGRICPTRYLGVKQWEVHWHASLFDGVSSGWYTDIPVCAFLGDRQKSPYFALASHDCSYSFSFTLIWIWLKTNVMRRGRLVFFFFLLFFFFLHHQSEFFFFFFFSDQPSNPPPGGNVGSAYTHCLRGVNITITVTLQFNLINLPYHPAFHPVKLGYRSFLTLRI